MNKKKIILISAISIVVLIALLVFPYAVYSQKLPLGVRVGGLRLGLQSESESIQRLEKKSHELEKKSVTIKIGNDTTSTTFRDIGFSLNSRKTVEEIKSRYQNKKDFLNYLYYAQLFYLPRVFEPSIAIDRAKFSKYYESFLASYAVEPQDAQLLIDENGKASIKNSSKGRTILEGILREKLVAVFKSDTKIVSLKYVILEPDISTEDANKKLSELSQWKNKKVFFYKDSLKAEISGEPIIKYLHGTKEEDKLEIAFSPGKLEEFLDKHFEKAGKPPVNASFKIASGKIEIIPHRNGIMPDASATAEIATAKLKSSDNAQVEVLFAEREPEITTRKASKMGINEEIASFTTSYNPGQTSRVTNIKLLAALLDGELIAPGEVFSFNERIGPRTIERGFRLAPTIVNGRLVDTAGGGACQVATTLFNTVFFAGVEVVERMNHSFYISKYPTGRDATVSYWGYDLKFKNDYQNWILIKASATSSKITISFYGTKEGRKVKYETSKASGFVGFRTETRKNPNLPSGYRKVEEAGIMGRSITVKRWVYDAIGKLIYEDVFRSRYSPKTQIVVVGTKVVSETEGSAESTGSTTN